MNINLNPDKNLQTICDEFTAYFPLLKIEFYRKSHKVGEGSSSKSQLDKNLSLLEVNILFIQNNFIFSKNSTVKDFEEMFEKLTSISIQVFRKTSSSWIQTIASDHWTLEMQQKEAEELNTKIDKDIPMDYQEQD